MMYFFLFFFFQAEDGIRDLYVTGVQTCALPISTFPFGRERGRQCAAPARARPGDDDEMREIEKIVPAMPGRQARESIVADDQRQRPGRGFAAQFRERGDRVARARTVDLARF